MATDAARWRFLADNNLVLNRSKSGVSIMHYTEGADSGLAPRFTSVATGKNADEAIDNAIKRWEKAHKKKWEP